MNIENITSKGISLDINGQSMQREVYEREIKKLQSNWNSLREWIKENSWYYNTSDGCQWVDQFKLLDKINELEGDVKE